MQTLVVASGKGGTGKTTVAVNLALSLVDRGIQLLDCDVEEPNAHLFVRPCFEKSYTVGIPVPEVDLERCTFCGRCADFCAFNALAVFSDQVMVLPELCHGCGGCAYLCPEKAITEKSRPIGAVEYGRASGLDFAHGRLNPGEAMSPPLIGAVKKLINPRRLTIIDAPPGTSCPVVATLSGVDYCLLVTEPTPFGLHDLDLAFQTVSKLDIPSGVLINRCDLGDDAVEVYCREKYLPVLQKIPMDLDLARHHARGEAAALHLPRWRERFRELFDCITASRKAVHR